MNENSSDKIRVVSLLVAAMLWGKRKRSVEHAIDRGRLRAVFLCGWWFVSVDDLNEIWGNHAPKNDRFLYVSDALMSSKIRREA